MYFLLFLQQNKSLANKAATFIRPNKFWLEGGCGCYAKYMKKMLQQCFPLHMHQQVSACHNIFLTVVQSYHSKVTPIDRLYADIAEAVLP